MKLRERIKEGDQRSAKWGSKRGARKQRGGLEKGSFSVQLDPLYIESSYATRSELVEEKLSKSGKNFNKISGLLFFGQKKKV